MDSPEAIRALRLLGSCLIFHVRSRRLLTVRKVSASSSGRSKQENSWRNWKKLSIVPGFKRIVRYPLNNSPSPETADRNLDDMWIAYAYPVCWLEMTNKQQPTKLITCRGRGGRHSVVESADRPPAAAAYLWWPTLRPPAPSWTYSPPYWRMSSSSVLTPRQEALIKYNFTE